MSKLRTTRASTSTTCGFDIFDSPNTWMLKLATRIAFPGFGTGPPGSCWPRAAATGAHSNTTATQAG